MKEKREIYRFLHVTPRRIFEQLDQYVIGQKHAKEVLAIAAYNHLKRIEYLKFGGQTTIRKSNILLICAGSFSDLDDVDEGKPIGFFNDGNGTGHEISTEDLVQYGFLPELLGRLPVRVQLEALSATDLVSILTQPREAMVPEY